MKTNAATMSARTSRQRRIRHAARRAVKRSISAADWRFEMNFFQCNML